MKPFLLIMACVLALASVSAQDANNTSTYSSNYVVTVTATIPVVVIGENVGYPGRRALHITFPSAKSAGCYLLPVDGNNAATFAAQVNNFSNHPTIGLHISPTNSIIGWTWDAHDLYQKTIIGVSDTAGSNAVINVYEPRGNKP